ncbi:hypothetical protein GCM10022280_11440 [Sphingomonas swuensis]|uniref:HTH LytTR-type domain-containing protein n=1 Tax=Sphingomonas swuensis TaxID=977800 RepID=A0ABP7SQR5_9SPHN
MPELAVLACLAFDIRAPADDLARFKQGLSHCPCVDSYMQASGKYDLIVECRFQSLAHYTDQVERMRPHLAQLASRLDFSFISSRIECREDGDGQAIWLPCEGGMKQVASSLVDKVLAEGDYMRVHVGEWNCLVHATMAHLSEQLAPPNFIRLRRSCLARVGFIERLTHEGRRWTARLKDGTEVAIAHSNVAAVMRLVAGESSTPRRDSSTNGALKEGLAPFNEIDLKLPH